MTLTTDRLLAGPASSPETARSSSGKGLVDRLWLGVCPLIAALACGLVLVLNWGGSDVAAATHRVLEYQAHGFAIWDSSWYGGQWTLNYSVAMPALGSWLGLHTCLLGASVLSALSFERITARWDSPGARPAAVAFAVLTIAPATIGQYPYLCGMALILVSVWAATARKWIPAFLAVVAGGLLSPLAGAFGCLALVSWWLVSQRLADGISQRWWPGRIDRNDRLAGPAAALLLAGVVVPVILTSVLLPGEGNMPFDFSDCAWDVLIALVLLALSLGRGRVIQVGLGIYALALVGSFLVASPVGGNAGRLGDSFAVPVAVGLLWGRRFRTPAWSLLLAAAVVVPMTLSSVVPAISGMRSLSTRADTRAFYRPLDRFLRAHDPHGLVGRVEVVPTVDHWESVWVATAEPLARGWERQTDFSDNSIFYPKDSKAPLSAAALYSWLVDNGVAYVALPRVTLDYAGTAEAAALEAGVPGLKQVLHNSSFTVWRVENSSGILNGDGRLLSYGNERVQFMADQPGIFQVRVSWSDNWSVTSGSACVVGGQRWTTVKVSRRGPVTIGVSDPLSAKTCGSGS